MMAPTNLFHSAVHTLWNKTIPRNSVVSTKILHNLRCSSGLVSTAVIRPRRFWDLHVPKPTWDYGHRVCLSLNRTKGDLKRAQNWVSIPDTHLPEPWTCDWARWPSLANRPPLEAVLPMRYAISDDPLTPVMFSSDSRIGCDFRRVTIFACPRSSTFYLYRAPDALGDPGYHDEEMWRFDGVFPSVGAFIAEADWNRIQKLEGDEDDESAVRPVSKMNIPQEFFATDGRAAANQPYSRRTLLDMCRPPGTYLYQSRDYQDCSRLESHFSLDRALREWPHIPDSDLPEPWSCRWEYFVETEEWYDSDDSAADELVRAYGPALDGVVPAMYVPLGHAQGDFVLCPPGGAGTYYLCWADGRDPDNSTMTAGHLQRFSGLYSSVQDFVSTADWNSLEPVPYAPTC
ncbi:hypothetical protein C8J57DRAFT_1334049 [Mycena rebaudengoi]|nr:hypothetical protein C8J57DRAFT_1334049 [Mycena rebaudengoi]